MIPKTPALDFDPGEKRISEETMFKQKSYTMMPIHLSRITI